MPLDIKKRIFSDEVQKKKEGSTVIVIGWAEVVKSLGKLTFIKLRDKEGTVQIIAFPKSKKFKVFGQIPLESVIIISGKVQKSKLKAGGKEILMQNFEIVSKAEKLPIDFSGKIETDLSKRLDYRYLDLRNPKTKAIFEIESEICRAYREFFRKDSFTEVWPPEIIAAASEGGTELFPVSYLGKKAFLAQSPQLYKQMLVANGLEKVFSIIPVWRAEPHDTHKHLNEIRQMDMELTFANQMDVINHLDRAVKYIIGQVKKNCSKQLKTLNRNLKIPKSKIISYKEAVSTLNKKGVKIKFGEDISSEAEKKLAKIFGMDTLIHIHSWPVSLKPFYIMPNSKNPKISEGFDTDYQGIELASGGQRIHIPELLIKTLKQKKLNPKNFKFYIDAFRYGSPPHAGWSIGLERLTMTICGLNNIRETCLFPRDRTRLTP